MQRQVRQRNSRSSDPRQVQGEKDQKGRVGMWERKAEGGDGGQSRLEMVKSGKEFVFDSACYGKPMKR